MPYWVFLKPSQLALGPKPPPLPWEQQFYTGVKWLGHGAVHSSPSSAKVHKQKYTSATPLCLNSWHGQWQLCLTFFYFLGHTLLTKEPVEIWLHPPKFLHDMILRHWENILILKNLLHSFKSEKVDLASSKSSWLDCKTFLLIKIFPALLLIMNMGYMILLVYISMGNNS